ncbi:MAG: HAMP domain-containing histidine kinase, partial [Bdellovibrionales bacterium]|nr:HAMP domain-containing histidine kinase [Bdellovibrionales bacterium]
MDYIPRRPEHILVADSSNKTRIEAVAALENFFPAAHLESAANWTTSQEKLAKEEFDIIILDLDVIADQPLLELIFLLKTFDYEPSVVIVAEHPPIHVLNDLYKFGCHRCIVKDERWIEELGTAVDYLIRIRKVSHENHLLRAKLTEANMMLQEKNSRLDEFTSTVAHDIRGPLGGITMKLEYLLEHWDQITLDRTRTLMERALSSSQRLIALVQSMYDYAKLGSKATRMESISLEQLLGEVIDDLNFPDELDIEIGLSNLPNIWGNSNLLRRVFINLLNNAVKYNDKEKIVINIAAEKVVDRLIGSFVEISLSDNGPGIPVREQKDIFSLFARGSTANGDTDGSGVGLAVV